MSDETTSGDVDAERRKHPRSPMVLRVEYPDRKEYLSDWTENVSAGGLFVCTNEPFEVGQALRVSVAFPDLLEPLVVDGVVAWQRPATAETKAGVGLRVKSDVTRRRLADLAFLAAQVPDGSGAPKSYRVLVVEDNPMVIRMFERVLKHMSSLGTTNVHLLPAGNGRMALDTLEQEGADLIITDLAMPIMDGLTLIKIVRSQPERANLPILAISCAAEDEGRASLEAGADAFVEKPFQFGAILETIICLLRRGSEPADPE